MYLLDLVTLKEPNNQLNMAILDFDNGGTIPKDARKF
jgi:hypothetical protein